MAVHFSCPNGVLTSEVATGVAERIPLPDGTVFPSADVIGVVLPPNGISITPNHGLTGDITALCDALSP